MKNKFDRAIDELKFSGSDEGIKYNFALSILRTLLSYAALSSLAAVEYAKDENDIPLLSQSASKLLKPSDGDLVFILDTLLPVLWNRNAYPETRGWFRDGISKLCYSIIFERNNRLGHGVFDQSTAQKCLALISNIEKILDCLGTVLPRNKSDELLVGDTKFPVPFVADALYCFREAGRKSDGWRYKYQTLNIWQSQDEMGFLDVNSTIPRLLSENRSVLNSKVITETWRPIFVLPDRQTYSFLGRTEQLNHLLEWWNDEYSRTCLLYGEGGIGKTTLALEFLNRVLDEEFVVDWHPEYIFFFSSKQTRWGINGMEYIPGVQTHLSEAVIALIAALDVVPIDQRWYSLNPAEIINRAGQIINELGLKNNILFVIDNAENLVRTREDESDLSAQIKLISRKIGRVIVTSRRREEIEAEPINILPLEDDEAETLLKRLLQEYGISDIAKTESLKGYVKKIGCKPILIEFLAKYSAITHATLDKGVQEILKQEGAHLGHFLFADSWGRIKEANRHVFMAIAQLGGFVDDVLLSLATEKFSVSRDDWISAYEETRYGDSNYYSGKQEIILDEGAQRFISGRYQDLSREEKRVIDSATQECRSKYAAYLSAQRTEINDRIEQAFVHPLARQAKIATAKGDLDAARALYEQAIITDSSNPHLLDRFAWFTMKYLRDLTAAEGIASHGYSLAPKDPELNFTLGMIYARQGNVQMADQHLDTASQNGKERYLVQLQKAHARYTSVWKTNNIAGENSRERIDTLIREAKVGVPKTKVHQRHNDESDSLRSKVGVLFRKIQAQS